MTTESISRDALESIERLYDQLQALVDVRIQLTEVRTIVSGLVMDVREVKTAVKGNGKPGLEQRVLSLENKLENHEVACPLAAKVGAQETGLSDIRRQLQEAADKKEQQEQDKKQRERDNRLWKMSLAASLILMLVSATVNIILGVLQLGAIN